MYRSELFSQDHESERTSPESIQVRTAKSRQELQAAFTLLQRRYTATGLSRSSRTAMRIMPYHLSKASQVFIAERANQVVGTITLVQDSHEGLPMVKSYPKAINSLRQRTERIGEIASLAVEPSHSARSQIFAKMTRLLTFFARQQGLQYLTAVVHPRHAKFYQRAMGFEIIGEETSYASVEGCPGIAVVGSVNDPSCYRPRWRDYYFGGSFSKHQLQPSLIDDDNYRYFYDQLVQQRSGLSAA